jgi:hypothetical protein
MTRPGSQGETDTNISTLDKTKKIKVSKMPSLLIHCCEFAAIGWLSWFTVHRLNAEAIKLLIEMPNQSAEIFKILQDYANNPETNCWIKAVGDWTLGPLVAPVEIDVFTWFNAIAVLVAYTIITLFSTNELSTKNRTYFRVIAIHATTVMMTEFLWWFYYELGENTLQQISTNMQILLVTVTMVYLGFRDWVVQE